MKKQSVLFILFLAGVLILSACSTQTQETTPTPILAQSNTILAEGRLKPVNSMTQSFSISGKIAEILIQEGESVQKDEVIAKLENSTEADLAVARAEQEVQAAKQAVDALDRTADTNLSQAKMDLYLAEEQLNETKEQFDNDETEQNKIAYEMASAAYQLAKDNLNRLQDGDGINPDLLNAAETRLRVAQLSLENAQALFNAYQLKATMDGVILNQNFQVGQLVSVGAPIVDIVDFSTWVIETDNLTELEVVNIEIGQDAQIIFDAMPEMNFTGKVTEIAQQYEEKRGDITYTVTLVLNEANQNLRWGMTASVTFDHND